jgi:hypothetical protein
MSYIVCWKIHEKKDWAIVPDKEIYAKETELREKGCIKGETCFFCPIEAGEGRGSEQPPATSNETSSDQRFAYLDYPDEKASGAKSDNTIQKFKTIAEQERIYNKEVAPAPKKKEQSDAPLEMTWEKIELQSSSDEEESSQRKHSEEFDTGKFARKVKKSRKKEISEIIRLINEENEEGDDQ